MCLRYGLAAEWLGGADALDRLRGQQCKGEGEEESKGRLVQLHVVNMSMHEGQ